MSCLFPQAIYPSSDKSYNRFYKNKSGKNKLLVRCNHCPNCIDERVRLWTYRLMAESKLYKKMCFVTLTYEDGQLPVERGTTCTKDVQKFFKKLRRYYDYHYNSCDMSYFGALEYGGEKGRIHAHLLILGLDYEDLIPSEKSVVSHNTINCKSPFWKYGILNYGTDVSLQDSRLVRYVTKYIEKIDTDNLYKYCRIMKMEMPKTFKSVGLGKDYLSMSIQNYGKLPLLNGLRCSLPPYWKKKLDYSSDHEDWIAQKENEFKQKMKREKLMVNQENTNENYARLIMRNKRGIL